MYSCIGVNNIYAIGDLIFNDQESLKIKFERILYFITRLP